MGIPGPHTPRENGVPGPHIPGSMGTRVPIFPGVWGPGIPILGGPHFHMTPALEMNRKEVDYMSLSLVTASEKSGLGNKLMIRSSYTHRYTIPSPDFILQLSIAQDET